MKRSIVLLALAVMTLNGCFISREHDRRDDDRYEHHHDGEHRDGDYRDRHDDHH